MRDPDPLPDLPQVDDPPPVKAPPVDPSPVAAQSAATPAISEDTPPFTPGGTKKKRAPGSRLRAETRANKRRDLELYKNSIVQAPHLPQSPPQVVAGIKLAKEPAKEPGRNWGRKLGRKRKKK